MDCKKRAEIRKLIGKFLSSDLLHYGVLMNFGEDEWGGEDSSFLQRKWGSAFLLVKPRSCSGKSPTFFRKSPTFLGKCPTFFGKSPTFFGKSPTFFGKSPTFLRLGPKLGLWWAVFGEQMQGERRNHAEH